MGDITAAMMFLSPVNRIIIAVSPALLAEIASSPGRDSPEIAWSVMPRQGYFDAPNSVAVALGTRRLRRGIPHVVGSKLASPLWTRI